MGCGQSKERDFTTAADPVEHPPLSSLVFSCCVADQLQGTTRFLPPQGLWQSCVVSAPLHPPISPTWIVCVGGPIQGAASVFSPEISPFNPQSLSHNLVKREPHVGGTGPSLCGGAAVGLSESPALSCHRHSMCQVVFQVKEVKLGTKDGFQLKL